MVKSLQVGVIHDWRFNGAVCVDRANSTYNATDNNAAAPAKDQMGRVDQAAFIGAVADLIVLPDIGDNKDWTSFEFWYNNHAEINTGTAAYPYCGPVYGNAGAGALNAIIMGAASGDFANEMIIVVVRKTDSGTAKCYWTTTDVGTTIAAGWHHYLWVWDAASTLYRLYIDGVDKGLGTLYVPEGPMQIVNHGTGTNWIPQFGTYEANEGLADDADYGRFRVWNRALTASEALQAYHEGFGPLQTYQGLFDGVRIYVPMNDGSAKDFSGNENDGVINNASQLAGPLNLSNSAVGIDADSDNITHAAGWTQGSLSTFFMWCKPTNGLTSTDSGNLFTMDSGAFYLSRGPVTGFVTGETLLCRTTGADYSYTTTTTSEEWQLIGMSWVPGSSNYIFYLDGVPQASAKRNSPLLYGSTTGATIYIGTYAGGTTPFTGSVGLYGFGSISWSDEYHKAFYDMTKNSYKFAYNAREHQ